MIRPTTTLPTLSTLAARCSAENLASNVRALSQQQPKLLAVVQEAEVDVEWLFGRDGSLTARNRSSRWISGCSVPLLAAREMLRTLDVRGAVACFLAPTHAAQLRAALFKLRKEQAIIAIVPERTNLRLMLCCDNFRREIESHRLWFVSSFNWEDQLSTLFEDEPGLAPPAQFIRVPVTDEDEIQHLIPRAQNVFSQVIRRRNTAMHMLSALAWDPPAMTRLCVVAPTQFRLWNDVGRVLTSAAREACGDSRDFAWTLFDADDPACSSPLGLASVARQCSAILTANTARCDLPGGIPQRMPWLTWVTTPRIPSFDASGPKDQLILSNQIFHAAALRAGWPGNRVHVGGWPALIDSAQDPAERADAPLTMIVDAASLDPPENLSEYSSHSLLWSGIRDELLDDPMRLGDDPDRYLTAHMRRLGIADVGFPRAMFIHHLLIPAWQQGIARLLLRAKIPLRLYGQNWYEIEEFTAPAAGAIESHDHLVEVLQQSRALVGAWAPAVHHPAEHSGVPIIHVRGRSREQFLSAARRLKPDPATSSEPPLTPELLRKILLAAEQ